MGEIKEYKAVIFDLDGTLYFQKPFRMGMAKYLVKRVFMHPATIRDILIIMKYRSIRENWSTVNTKEPYDIAGMPRERPNEEKKALDKNEWSALDRAQYTYVAGKMHCTPEKVAKIIYYYMQKAPLHILPAYRDEVLTEIIEQLQKRGITVAVYSDYPVFDKLKALGFDIDERYQFAASDEVINCMKPDPQGLMNILNILDCKSENALMVGDRMEKDGLCAKKNRVDYIILEASRKKRSATEEKLKTMLGL